MSSPWSDAGTVAGFAQAAPNATLMRFAESELARGGRRLLDIGCGAARNAVPLAGLGWNVTAVDLSRPMIDAAASRIRPRTTAGRVDLVVAAMESLPVPSQSIDVIVAHGIWNLARSAAQFRQAVREAARVARPGAALFVFTFSRATLAADAAPVVGEPFVFTQFSGEPQCFLTEAQLVAELRAAGFESDPAVPLTEHNRPRAGSFRAGGPPVIFEGTFRYTRATVRRDPVSGVPVVPANPDRICWGCDKFCRADDLACGNGTIRTPHPVELFGTDWLEWIEEPR